METVEFLGQTCLVLENDSLRLLVTRSVGPRVLALIPRGGENLFAELPNLTISQPGQQDFHFYGGHRLWHAPEEPARTYLPDDQPVEVEELPSGLRLSQEECSNGIRKTIEVRLAGMGPRVFVTHFLTNRGPWPISCAPWAITQLKVGGVAILPQSQAQTGVLPNRALAIWPYADLTNPGIHWGNRYILVEARMASPFKIGFPNPRGWLAYWWNEILFVKRAAYEPGAYYYDFGSSSECYCNDRFLELETLAPSRLLECGQSVSHHETWEVYNDVPRPHNEADVDEQVRRFHLEE